MNLRNEAMRTMIAFVLFLLLVPATGFGEYHGYSRGYSGSPYGPRTYNSSGYGHGYNNGSYGHGHGHNDDGWIVPLAIVGGVLGVVALSQMSAQPQPPPPPQRICRDAYNYTDEYGRYLYTRYVDRPCY